jgi:translation elongation factor EF-Tu-like GTPase
MELLLDPKTKHELAAVVAEEVVRILSECEFPTQSAPVEKKDEPILLNAKQMMKRLGVSWETFCKVRDMEGCPKVVFNKRTMYKPDDIEKFVSESFSSVA